MTERYSSNIIDKAKKIRILVLDVDGVLTGGELIYDNDGNEFKIFNVNDGIGIHMIKKSGLKCAVITAKGSKVVKRRAKDLRIDKVYKNFHYKIKALYKIMRKFSVKEEEICFIGDDLIDIPVLKRVGLSVAPLNAVDEVKPYADIVTEKKGGQGAVREICNLILRAQGTWDNVTKRYFE